MIYSYYMIYENNKTHIHYILPQDKTDWGRVFNASERSGAWHCMHTQYKI